MGVPRRLQMMSRLLSLCRDSCLVPSVLWVPIFRRWSAGLSLSFPARGWSCGPLLEADASVESKPALHGKVTVARQKAQEHQPWVTHPIFRLVGLAVAEDIIDVEGEGTGGEIVHHEVDVRDCVRTDGVSDGETEDALDVVVLVQLAGDTVEDSIDECPRLVKVHVEIPIGEHGRDARVVERVPFLISRIGQLLLRYAIDTVDIEIVDSEFVGLDGNIGHCSRPFYRCFSLN